LIGLEQHPEIDRYVTECLDDYRFAKHADIIFRSAISNGADELPGVWLRPCACNAASIALGHSTASPGTISASKGQRYEIAPRHHSGHPMISLPIHVVLAMSQSAGRCDTAIHDAIANNQTTITSRFIFIGAA
jgi:hypothetical protein